VCRGLKKVLISPAKHKMKVIYLLKKWSKTSKNGVKPQKIEE